MEWKKNESITESVPPVMVVDALCILRKNSHNKLVNSNATNLPFKNEKTLPNTYVRRANEKKKQKERGKEEEQKRDFFFVRGKNKMLNQTQNVWTYKQ